MSETIEPRLHEIGWRVGEGRRVHALPVAAALAAGGHVVSDENAPGWWTLADAEGNEVDVAPWPDRD